MDNIINSLDTIDELGIFIDKYNDELYDVLFTSCANLVKRVLYPYRSIMIKFTNTDIHNGFIAKYIVEYKKSKYASRWVFDKDDPIPIKYSTIKFKYLIVTFKSTAKSMYGFNFKNLSTIVDIINILVMQFRFNHMENINTINDRLSTDILNNQA